MMKVCNPHTKAKKHHPKKERKKERKLQASITEKHICKITLTKYWETKFNNTLKGSYTVIKWDLFQGCKNGLISTNKSV